MSLYIRLSTQALTDAKLLAAGPEASWMWVRGLLYAKEHLTDGFVPGEVLPLLTLGIAEAEKAVAKLLQTGLWEEVEGGYTVGAGRWARWQTTAEEVEEQRESNRRRVAEWRNKKKEKRDVAEPSSEEPIAKDAPEESVPDPEPNPVMDVLQRYTVPCNNGCNADVTSPEHRAIAQSTEHIDKTNTVCTELENRELDAGTQQGEVFPDNGELQTNLPESKPEPDCVPSERIVGTLPLVDGSNYRVSERQAEGWSTAFPAVDVMQQLCEMKVWTQAHKSRRKTRRGIERFVVSWLSREQDKGRSTPGMAQGGTYGQHVAATGVINKREQREQRNRAVVDNLRERIFGHQHVGNNDSQSQAHGATGRGYDAADLDRSVVVLPPAGA